MAKNDASKVQNQLDYRGGESSNMLDNTFNNLLPQNQSLQNRYNVAADSAQNNFGNLMGNYQSFLGSPGASYNAPHQNFGAYGGYQDFANTGGFSPQNIQDIRARSNAPIRATYANAQSNIDRQRTLQGGYSPNYTAATAKLTRDLGYSLGDQAQNTEAMLAEAIRSGKLAGLSGMTGIDTSRMGEGLTNAGQDVSTQLSNRGQGLQAMSGMNSLFGTTPGMASMFGSQLGQSNSQMNEIQSLRQALAQMMINAQLGKSTVPSNYQQALGNIGGTLNLGGQVAGSFAGLPGDGTTGLNQVGTVVRP